MKTQEYIKKYKLNVSDQFSHKFFAIDFGNEFLSRLEVYKTFSRWGETKFWSLVDEMDNKWFQIEKKTAGILPERLWYYIFDEIFIGTYDNEFPEIAKKKRIIDKSNISDIKKLILEWDLLEEKLEYPSWMERTFLDDVEFEWDHKLVENGIGELGLRPTFGYEKFEKKVIAKNNHLLFYCFDELTYQLKKMAASKAKTQFRINLNQKKRRDEENEFFNWWKFVSSNGNRTNPNEYNPYFQLLNLTKEADEKSVNKRYRELSMIKHPDKGGNQDEFIELTEAKNKCLEYFSIFSSVKVA